MPPPRYIDAPTTDGGITYNLTAEQANMLGITEEEITAAEKRFEIKTFGPWSIIQTIRAIAEVPEPGTQSYPEPPQKKTSYRRFYPVRTLHHARESGYVHEGRVAIEGKKYRAFTTSTLIQITDRASSLDPAKPRLMSVATLYVCVPD